MQIANLNGLYSGPKWEKFFKWVAELQIKQDF